MAEPTRWMLERMQEDMSRRGFMAACGKVVAALGMATMGVAVWSRTAHAFCCPDGDCGAGCPGAGAPGCPANCPPHASPSECCENGVKQVCYHCRCSGGSQCNCQYATTISC
jgi:hypothetical protein